MSDLRPCPRMTDEKIKQTAYELVQGRLVVASAVPEELVSSIFMVLALGGLGDIDPETVGNIYEHIDQAGERGINGWPMFMSMQVAHKDDWKQIFELYEKANAALTEVFDEPQ